LEAVASVLRWSIVAPLETMLVMIVQVVTRGMPKVFVMFEPRSEGSNITKTAYRTPL
jgi:hypothetical protein